jgi:ATP-dependent Clp protease ATP-binding subunit ClpC
MTRPPELKEREAKIDEIRKKKEEAIRGQKFEEAAAHRADLHAVHADGGAAHALQQHPHASAPVLMRCSYVNSILAPGHRRRQRRQHSTGTIDRRRRPTR